MSFQNWDLLIYRNEGNLGNTLQTYGLSLFTGPTRGIWYDNIFNNENETLLCNGWFQSPYQKINPSTKVIFAGIHITDLPGYDNSATMTWLKNSRNNRIGARDPATANFLNKAGFKAVFIGCSSLLLPSYDGPREGVVYADWTDTPGEVTHKISESLPWDCKWMEVERILNIYKKAKTVYTGRLHAALPCLALGTPVCIRKNSDTSRFSILEALGVSFNKICKVNVEPFRKRFKSFVEEESGRQIKLGSPCMPVVQCQIAGDTFENRYPSLFRIIKEKVPAPLKILCFGCSVGNECLDIQKIYPSATITGIESCENRLTEARKKTSQNINFYRTIPEARIDKYDLILAMSVFCRCSNSSPETTSATGYDFMDFTEGVKRLDGFLRGNGNLAIFNSNFSFFDTEIARKYETLATADVEENVAKFNLKNKRSLGRDDRKPFVPFLFIKRKTS